MTLFLLKAIVPGAATGDLFPESVSVGGHTRRGKFIAPYTSTRHKHHAANTLMLHGRKLEFPDKAHRDLFYLGVRDLAGLPPSTEEVKRLWAHFRGFVDDDPDAGQPFAAPRHVMALARDYAGEARDDLCSRPGKGPVKIGTVLNPDEAGRYWQREAG